MSEPVADVREAAVLERIEAFRRRRPRFKDEVVTLAHGAGGKASAVRDCTALRSNPRMRI